MLGLLANSQGGEHGARLASRDHFREIAHTPETPSTGDLERLERWRSALGELLAVEIPAEKSWYKTGPSDVLVLSETNRFQVKPLSYYSSVARNLASVRGTRLYARPEYRDTAQERLKDID